MTYDIALQAVLKHEGGYQAIPADNGNWSGGKRGVGRLIGTNMGIAAPTLIRWRKRHGYHVTTASDMKELSRDIVKQIYREQYAAPIRFDDLPDGLDYLVFDTAIHAGPRRASQFLQRIVGAKVDGVIGLNTLGATADYVQANSVAKLIQEYASARLRHLKSLSTWGKFKNGWTRRIQEAVKLALQLDARQEDLDWIETIRPVPEKPQGREKRPVAENARDIGGLGAVVTEAAKQVEPLASASQIAQYAFIALLMIGIGLAVYSWRKSRVEDA